MVGTRFREFHASSSEPKQEYNKNLGYDLKVNYNCHNYTFAVSLRGDPLAFYRSISQKC